MLSLAILSLLSSTALALDNGLFLTPPMGFLSWERFRCITDCETYPDDCISEKLYMQMADRMAEDGWLEAGYNWINIDDCWSDISGREATTGELMADPKRFPSGMKALGDYIHSKGLKYGLYSDIGDKTCAKYPGSYGHYEQDAKTFANWGVDSLKFDGCNLNATMLPTVFPAMAKALNETGRPIAFICVWGPYTNGNFDHAIARKYCNQWRNYQDIQDDMESVNSIVDWFVANSNSTIPASGPGGWNDPDMLLVGGFGLTLGEQQLQMALWAILAAPLLMGNDLRDISPESKAILLNKEVIAISQDPLGAQGYRVSGDATSPEVWIRHLANGDVAVAAMHRNRHDPYMPYVMDIDFATVLKDEASYYVRDVLSHQNLGQHKKSMRISMQPYSVQMFRFSKKQFNETSKSSNDNDLMVVDNSPSVGGWIGGTILGFGMASLMVFAVRKRQRMNHYQSLN